MSRNTRRYAFCSAILILVAIGSYFLLAQLRIGPETGLTQQQKEIDDHLRNYYLAYGNKSVIRLLALFDEQAILSAPDGTICKSSDEIRSYYDRMLMTYRGFSIVKTVVRIEVRGTDASAVYDTRVRPRTLAGDREPPQLFYRDSFALTKKDASWKITALLIETSQAK